MFSIQGLIGAALAIISVFVMLVAKTWVSENEIDKLSLSLATQVSENALCNAEKRSLENALDEQTREVERNRLALKKAQEVLEHVKPKITTRYRIPKNDANKTCETQLEQIKKTMEIYHADR